jgi:hypothetical protein
LSALRCRARRGKVGAFIEQQFGLVYESRSGLVALLRGAGRGRFGVSMSAVYPLQRRTAVSEV